MAARVQIIVEAKDAASNTLRTVSSGFGSFVANAKKAGMSLTELNSGLAIASQGLQKLKQGYDFAKEGASLDFTATKFDRLARSIGTTGDALLGKMKVATQGTLSDFKAMAAATDILSLGLTKTEKDTIRLAKVQSGLAMDTNQLVLALTNQTTMRFDQLGVSVAGFEEKVKSLEAAGMSAQDAFTEAFLRQAEEQLLKVGNAADENIGKFMKFEAAVENVSNSLKVMAGEALADDMGAFAWQLGHTNEVLDEMGRLAKEAGYGFTGTLRGLQENAEANVRVREETRKTYEATVEARESWEGYTEVIDGANGVLAMTPEKLKAISQANTEFIGVLGNVSSAMQTYKQGVSEADAALTAGKITADEHKAKVAELAATYEEASARIVQSIVAMKLATDGWTDSELDAYLSISKGLGLVTDSEIKAAKMAVHLADTMIETGEPLDHAGKRALDAAFGLDSLGSSAEATGEKIQSTALPAVSALKSAIAKLPASGTSWEYFFQINVQGRVPQGLPAVPISAPSPGSPGYVDPNPIAQQSGGEVYAGQPYMVGERGPEPFIPAQSGRILGHAESLHAMTLGGGMGGGGGTNYFYGPVTITADSDAGGDVMSLR